MMGAGKSSVGRLLAARRGATFVDLDVRIELVFAATIAELFEHGEDYFRACERAALRSLLREPGFAGASVVVATGGGIVQDASNLDDIAAIGSTVYLELAPERLAARLSTPEQLAARPLLDDDPRSGGSEAPAQRREGQVDPVALEQRLTTLLRVREHAYRRADVTVDADGLPEQVAARVEQGLGVR
jgi:shikimate kinase